MFNSQKNTKCKREYVGKKNRLLVFNSLGKKVSSQMKQNILCSDKSSDTKI